MTSIYARAFLVSVAVAALSDNALEIVVACLALSFAFMLTDWEAERC